MADANSSDLHDFIVIAIEPDDDSQLDGIAVTLTDKRGGKVRLHLKTDLAEELRERLSLALDKRQGP